MISPTTLNELRVALENGSTGKITSLIRFHASDLIAAAERAARLVKAIHDEEELDGPMPDSVWSLCSTREGCAEVLRANIRAMKNNLLSALNQSEP